MARSRDAELDQFAVELWTCMTQIVHRMKQPNGGLAEKHGLTGQQMFTLWRVSEDGPLTMSEFAALFGVSHGVATRMVDRLVDKGMVSRRRDDADRRVVRVSASKLGRRVAEDAIAEVQGFIKSVFKGVSREDREQYLSILRRIGKAQAGG